MSTIAFARSGFLFATNQRLLFPLFLHLWVIDDSGQEELVSAIGQVGKGGIACYARQDDHGR